MMRLLDGVWSSGETWFSSELDVLASRDFAVIEFGPLGDIGHLSMCGCAGCLSKLQIASDATSGGDALTTGGGLKFQASLASKTGDLPLALGDDIADNATSTTSILVGGSLASSIQSLGDLDYIRVSLVAGQTYTFSVQTTSGTLDPYVELRTAAGAVIGAGVEDDDGGILTNSLLMYRPTTSGDYFIVVRSWADPQGGSLTTGGYSLAVNAITTGNTSPTTFAGNGKPFFSWDEAAIQITRDGASWATAFSAPATVTYAFRSAAPGAMPDDTGGFSRFSAAQISAAEAALAAWSAVANINFVRVQDGDGYSNNASILFGNYATGAAGASAFAYLPSSANTSAASVQGDVWINNSLSGNNDLSLGGFGLHVLLHEIGHALGLSHPGEYNAAEGVSITYGADAEYFNDSRMFTAMSYFASSNTGGTLPGFSSIPQSHDIAAIQRLYGANMASRAGDTIYGFNSNTGVPAYTLALASQGAVFAVWDGGGTDTLDFSGYATNNTIDLREEAFSSVGPDNGGVGLAAFNISIARGAIIENAIGGSGNDTLIGNAIANTLSGLDGNDFLTGGAGDDFLLGGEGNDTAILSASRAAYEVVAYGGEIATIHLGSFERDRFNSIEQLQFSDQTVTASSLPVFDPYQYIATYNDLINAIGADPDAGFRHFVRFGVVEGRTRDGFDGFQYIAGWNDLITAFGANEQIAASHFIQFGFAEGRGRDIFDGLQYIAGYNDLVTSLGADERAGALHFIQTGFSAGRLRDNFDGLQYIAGWADLINAFGANENAAALHFIRFGFGEGRARDSFDGLQYIASYNDLTSAFGGDEHAGALHYILFGFGEGRERDRFDGLQYVAAWDDLINTIGMNENAAAAHFLSAAGRPRDVFDGLQYIASYGDLIQAFGDNENAGAAHFIQFGFAAGRSRDLFDAQQYLNNYADLQAAYGSDLDAATRHFIIFGFYEGRTDDPLI